MIEDKVEERRQTFLRAFRRFCHPAAAAGAVEHRKIELLIGRIEIGEKVEDFVQHVPMPLVRPIDLVDCDDGSKSALQCLRDDEFRLWQRTFRRIDEHDNAVDHIEDALDLAAEVGMSRRVDDVDPHVFPNDAGAFGEDGDAALALQIVAVHRALGNLLVFPEGAGLFEEFVDERGLAMIDVSDDRDVAKVHVSLNDAPSRRK